MKNMRAKAHAEIMALLEGADDAKRSKVPLMHDPWQVDRECATGDVLRHGEHLYRCLQSHTSQADWPPDKAPSLWVQIMYRDGYRIIPKVITSPEAFAYGELGWEDDVLYRSLRDGNAFPPSVTPEWWEAVE